jgi:hypothetical protein
MLGNSENLTHAHELINAVEELESQDLVEFIPGESAKNDRIPTSYANTLEANIYATFNSGYKFIYELLQNADDAGAIRLQFTLYENDLVISHNGDPFTAEYVNKLCDKAKPLDKTGYKGVGFKAIFCISKKVTIISDPYCFQLDESFGHQTEQAKYAWPVIPVLIDRTTIQEQLPNGQDFKIDFTLSQIVSNKIQKDLDTVFQSTEVLRFHKLNANFDRCKII